MFLNESTWKLGTVLLNQSSYEDCKYQIQHGK